MLSFGKNEIYLLYVSNDVLNFEKIELKYILAFLNYIFDDNFGDKFR